MLQAWRDGRVVEGVRLESVCASNRTAGSNPVLSAKLIQFFKVLMLLRILVGQNREYLFVCHHLVL